MKLNCGSIDFCEYMQWRSSRYIWMECSTFVATGSSTSTNGQLSVSRPCFALSRRKVVCTRDGIAMTTQITCQRPKDLIERPQASRREWRDLCAVVTSKIMDQCTTRVPFVVCMPSFLPFTPRV